MVDLVKGKGISATSGAGSPIRSITRLDSGTLPDVVISGNRYLRRGTIETDITKFDTTIWNSSTPIKQSQVATTLGVNKYLAGSHFEPISNNILTVANGSNTTLSLRSIDGGVTFTTVQLPTAAKQPVFSAGWWIIGDTGNTNGTAYRSNDLFTTSTLVSTGLGALTTDLLIASPTTALAYNNTSAAVMRSINGGSTWVFMPSPIPINLDNRGVYGNGIFLLIGRTTGTYTSIDDGVTFVEHLGVLPITPNIYTWLYFDGTKFILIDSNFKQMTTSIDGITWTQVQTVKGINNTYSSRPIYSNSIYAVTDGALDAFISTDGINFAKYYLDSTYYASLIHTSNGIAIVHANSHTDLLKLAPFAGDLTSTPSTSTYTNNDFVRIS